MKTRWIILGLILLALLGLFAAGLWFFSRAEVGKQPSDATYGLITAPLNGDVVFAGDSVYVESTFILSQRNLAGVESYVDGARYVLDESLQPYSGQAGANCPTDDPAFCGRIEMRTLWIPAELGSHTLSVCVSGDPAQGDEWSVCSDVINVTVTDPTALPATAGAYLPLEGDTLQSVAYKFGLSPLLVAAANPGIEPVAQLPLGIPVNIPADPALFVTFDSAGSYYNVDKVTLQVDPSLDKVYCYYSLGENYWTRLPASQASFAYPLSGQLDLTGYFRTLPIPAAGGSLALECWGWSGGALVPLGSGKAELRSGVSKTSQVRGEHFVLDIDLIVIPDSGEIRGPTLIIPPPQALTNTNNLTVCSDHGMPALFCKFAIEIAPEKGKHRSDDILVWEWLTPLFPPDDPTIGWLTEIDGYHLYQYYPGGTPKLIKTISYPKQKVFIMPSLKFSLLYTYFVRAFAGDIESADSNHYSMGGTTSGLATVAIEPSTELYGGQTKHKENTNPLSSCKKGGLAPAIAGSAEASKSEIAVGWDHFEPGGDSCTIYSWEYSRAQVAFDLSAVKGPVSSAELSYRQDFTSRAGESCARELRVVTTTGSVAIKDLSSDPHSLLSTYGYSGTVFKSDVTDAVRDWMLGSPNAGFLFIGADESLPSGDCGGLFEKGCIGSPSESCWTTYSGLLLTVTYFVP